jgi:hypothetical protein
LLERAEHTCLIANSLRGTRALDARVIMSGESTHTVTQDSARQ